MTAPTAERVAELIVEAAGREAYALAGDPHGQAFWTDTIAALRQGQEKQRPSLEPPADLVQMLDDLVDAAKDQNASGVLLEAKRQNILNYAWCVGRAARPPVAVTKSARAAQVEPPPESSAGMPPHRVQAMRTLEANLRSEGQTSRAACVRELIDEIERLQSHARELESLLFTYRSERAEQAEPVSADPGCRYAGPCEYKYGTAPSPPVAQQPVSESFDMLAAIKERLAVPKGHFCRGIVDRFTCHNCGRHYDEHAHTDEASLCPVAQQPTGDRNE